MEVFLISAASGALKAVTMKLATLLATEFKNMKDVRKEMEPLSDELNWMHAFLEKMSEQENLIDHQDKIWMTDVREMSYDIEDSLDDFMICIDDGKSDKKKGLIKKCKKLLTRMNVNRRMSKAIQEFKIQIKAVGERNQRYRTGVSVMSSRDSNGMVDIRALVIFKEASDLVGVDEPKKELISLLMEDGSSSQDEVKVVSVVGIGGLGKTTLANQVYHSLKDTFDYKAFVSVSRNPDMMKVLRTILCDVSNEAYTTTEAGDLQHLIQRVSDFLQDKKYFIVVDDLWDTKSWEIIKCAFTKNNHGSIIITTTRINEVAEACCSSYRGHKYALHPLNIVNSRRLFWKRIFGLEEGCPSQLTKVSDDILKKCDGLPLAIISIAGLLAGKAPTFDEWDKVQRSFGYALERQTDVNKMMQILSLSYFDLPSHLRSCLLYLSMFPEDHEIRKERLVLRWIAEGFIPDQDHGFTQYELGERCFNELINRSLIQPWNSNTSGTLFSCRVHDIILEFIVSRAMEENFVTLFGMPNTTIDPRRKVRRLSVQARNEAGDGSIGLQENMIYSHARTISLFPDSLDSLPSLLKLIHVRVLNLEDCEGLQAHHLEYLGSLFALRYLSLRNTWIHELPEEIGELQYLQTLDVRGTYIKDLPPSVVHLARLVNLLCKFHMHLPDESSNMQSLQRLDGINISSQSPSFAQELCQLTNLRMLEVWVDEFTEDLASSLCKLGTGNLNSLIMCGRQAAINGVMEPWSPRPLSLKLLEMWDINFPRVPRWISSLDNLQHLALNVDQLGPADVGMLGRLNALSCLYLCVTTEVADRSSSSMDSKNRVVRFPKVENLSLRLKNGSSYQGIQRVKISRAHGFPCLRKFRVGSLNCGFGLFFEPGAMPKLQELNLQFSADKTGSFTNGEFDFGIQHLPCLAIVRCDLGYNLVQYGGEKYEPKHPAWDALKIAVSSNPSHPLLYHETSFVSEYISRRLRDYNGDKI